MSGYIPVKKGTDASLQTGAPVYADRRGGAEPSSPASQDVVDRHSATIAAWVGAQRQNVANSTVQVHNARLSHPEFDVHYSSVQGAERVTVTPKPAAPGETQPQKQESQQQDQPDQDQPPALTPQKDKPTAANPLSLMVFYYTTNGSGEREAQVAAVGMKDLTQPEVQYQGAPPKTDWVNKTGDRLQILQLKLGTTEFILLPIDITGQTAASNFHVLTTALGDTTATEASVEEVPVMNGTETSVFTMGGLYSYDQEKGFKHELSLPTEPSSFGAPVHTTPHAIGPDGTCYYLPQLTGSTLMQLSPTCLPLFTKSLQLQQQLEKKENDLAVGFNSVVAASPSVLIYTKVIEDVLTGTRTYHDNFDVTSVTAQIRLGTKHSVGISGESYYGVSGFGQAITLAGYSHAEGSQDYTNYTGGQTGFNVVTAYGTANKLDSNFPLPDYSSSGLTINPNAYQATLLQSTKVIYLYDGTPFRAANTNEIASGPGVRYDVETNPVAYKEATYSVGGYSPKGTRPPRPDNDGRYGDNDLSDFYETLKQEFQALPNFLALVEVDMIPLSLVSGAGDGVGYVSSTGQYTNTDENNREPWPEGDVIEVAASYGGSEGGGGYSASASSQHFPYQYTTSTYQIVNASLSIFGDSLTYSYDGSTSAPYPEAGILPYSFPPMYNGKAYYVRLTGTQDVPVWDVVTPFIVHHNVIGNVYSLIPWLHVSNGQHSIQGYYLDGQPYLWLDSGAGGNYVTKLAAAIGCKPEDIVGMVMDVTLNKVKQVANVKPPAYSGGSAPPPGGGVGVG